MIDLNVKCSGGMCFVVLELDRSKCPAVGGGRVGEKYPAVFVTTNLHLTMRNLNFNPVCSRNFETCQRHSAPSKPSCGTKPLS